MNTQLINPAALVAALSVPYSSHAGGPGLWQRLVERIGEEVRYHRTLNELRHLDDHDLDDLNLCRGDLPKLVRAEIASRRN